MLNKKIKVKVLKVKLFQDVAHFNVWKPVLFVIIFAGLGGYVIWQSFAAVPIIASVQAEKMTLPTGTSIVKDTNASGGQAVKMSLNGSLTTPVNLTSKATSLSVVARGTKCRRGWPQIDVTVDGKAVIAWTQVSSTSWTTYNSSSLSLAAGTHSLSIGANNTGSCGRYLYVDVTNFLGPVSPPPTPTATISATPSSINAGQASVLTWSSTNANSCTASGAWSGTEPTSGSISTGALNATSAYALTCQGSGGTASASATVTVNSVVGSGPCQTDGCLVQTLFSAPGPITSPIPANPVIDPNSAHYVSELVAGTPGGNVLGGGGGSTEWGITYYYSTASDPSYNITFAHTNDWFGGQNPFNTSVKAVSGSGSCNPLHIPSNVTVPGGYAQASDYATGSEWEPDSSMWIIDKTKPGLACFIWQASKVTGTWTGSAGGVFDLNGDGTKTLAGFGVGSGLANNSPLESEVQKGVIPHALNFAWTGNSSPAHNSAMIASGGSSAVWSFRYPANGTDGQTTGDMEEGMRFQLNPSFNCAGLPTKYDQVVCVALQKYGMYDGDSGGGGVGFQLQTDDFTDPARAPWKTPGEPERPGGIYCNAGLCTNTSGLSIPLNQFRLLSHWDGS